MTSINVPETIKDDNPIDSDDASPLMIAVRNGDFKMFKYLLEHGTNVNDNNSRELMLLAAMYSRNYDDAKYLLNHGANINTYDEHGNTPLLIAITNGATDFIYYLIENGASVYHMNNRGDTPITLAKTRLGINLNAHP